MVSLRQLLMWSVVRHVYESAHFWYNSCSGIALQYTQDIQDLTKLIIQLVDF